LRRQSRQFVVEILRRGPVSICEPADGIATPGRPAARPPGAVVVLIRLTAPELMTIPCHRSTRVVARAGRGFAPSSSEGFVARYCRDFSVSFVDNPSLVATAAMYKRSAICREFVPLNRRIHRKAAPTSIALHTQMHKQVVVMALINRLAQITGLSPAMSHRRGAEYIFHKVVQRHAQGVEGSFLMTLLQICVVFVIHCAKIKLDSVQWFL